ncbi:hypothetical protein [Sulfurimonas sp.]|uniref:hypothetical protein n=1 Tax=Sulfurimonas sp. TaxID=2022749 RepID=UPI0025CC9A13|nr:hypothetical protein [Sulfurimonas sp.]
MKIYIVIAILTFPLFLLAQSSVDEARNKSGVELFFENYDWDSMWAEVTMTFKITTCTPENTDKGFISPYIATITEPLYLAGVSIRKGEMKAFSTTLLEDASKTGNNSDDGGIYVNLIKFPLMNMLLKNTTRGAMVFEKGSINPVYIGIFDPKKWDNIMASDMTPEKKIFASVRAQLASAVTCVAYSGLDAMSPSSRRVSGIAEKLKDTIDLFYFSTGCLGPTPTGTSTVHQDPISNGILAINSIFYDMFSRRGVVADISANHTTRNILNNHSKEILCRSVINPIFPQSAYTTQLLFPTISKTHELGVSPAQYNFHGAGESGKNVFFIINQRRDYAAFAYQE